MSLMNEMDEAYSRDSANERELRRVARELETLVQSVRLAPTKRDEAERTVKALREQADHIVAVWN